MRRVNPKVCRIRLPNQQPRGSYYFYFGGLKMSLFKDVVDLAKAGWKPSDVKAILDLDQKMEDSAKNENQDVELQPKNKSEEKKEKVEEIDYKAKYEEAQKKLDKIYDENSREEVTPDDPDMYEIISGIASRL